MNLSNIVRTQQAALFDVCEFPVDQKLKLLYRASDDGFSSDKFHEKCDGIKNTLTIIKTTNENIFGGFTGAAWNSNNEYIHDTNSFIFSLVNQSSAPFKSKCIKNKYSICGNSSLGPIFGGYNIFNDNDIRISSDSDSNFGSFSRLGHRYENTEMSYSILAGSRYFQTKDIEVYEKLN